VLAAGPESINLGLVLCDVAVDFVSVLEIEHDDLMDERELQRGELTEEHFGGEAVVVLINEVIKTNAVSRQADFTVGVPVKAGRQQTD
jgi:geranylgeranyl pyrophosphate synthase